MFRLSYEERFQDKIVPCLLKLLLLDRVELLAETDKLGPKVCCLLSSPAGFCLRSLQGRESKTPGGKTEVRLSGYISFMHLFRSDVVLTL